LFLIRKNSCPKFLQFLKFTSDPPLLMVLECEKCSQLRLHLVENTLFGRLLKTYLFDWGCSA